MATENILNAKLKIEFENGFTESGKQKVKSKLFSSINPVVQLDALVETGNNLANFCSKAKLGLKKIVESELVEGE